MAIVVSCVAVAITILAAAMVGVTLGLSHMMDELSSKMISPLMLLLTLSRWYKARNALPQKLTNK